jgi:hypothetical protein
MSRQPEITATRKVDTGNQAIGITDEPAAVWTLATATFITDVARSLGLDPETTMTSIGMGEPARQDQHSVTRWPMPAQQQGRTVLDMMRVHLWGNVEAGPGPWDQKIRESRSRHNSYVVYANLGPDVGVLQLWSTAAPGLRHLDNRWVPSLTRWTQTPGTKRLDVDKTVKVFEMYDVFRRIDDMDPNEALTTALLM